MKIQVLQENLTKGLNTAARSVAVKAQLPVLSHVLLKTDNNRLQISATNLETGVTLWVGAKIESEGEITVPARVLTEIVASLPAGKVDLTVKDGVLTVNSTGYEARLNGGNASEFPKLPPVSAETRLSLPAAKISSAISQVAFAAATDEGRPVLTGVLLKAEGSKLSLVATDGYRLSLKTLDLEQPVDKDFGLLLPAKTLLEVARIVADEKGEKEGLVQLGFTQGQNQAVFVFPELSLYSRVIEGDFPDYHQIIPTEAASKASFDLESLTQAVKVVSIFARESANIVRFNIHQDRADLSANSPQVGENKSTVEVKLEGEPGEIAFNYRFLQSYLAAVAGEQVTLVMNGPLSSGVFRVEGDPSLLHLIMPVRLQNEKE